MRWVVHWIVGEAALRGRRSLAFQLGCLMPDWFELKPIHRWRESGSKFLDRAERVRSMPDGWRRDWLLGTLAHFACDYCTMAHNEEYYRFYHHRAYEVLAQNYLIRRCRENARWLQTGPAEMPAVLTSSADASAFRQALSVWVLDHTDALHEKISELHTAKWYQDERVAELDIREGFLLASELVRLMETGRKKKRQTGT